MARILKFSSAVLGYTWRKTLAFIKTLTLEPLIFVYIFAQAIVYGSALTQDMLIRKMCFVELGYSYESKLDIVCARK